MKKTLLIIFFPFCSCVVLGQFKFIKKAESSPINIGLLSQIDFSDRTIFDSPYRFERNLNNFYQIGLQSGYSYNENIEFTLDYHFSTGIIEPRINTYKYVLNNINTHVVGPGLNISFLNRLIVSPYFIFRFYKVFNYPAELESYSEEKITLNNFQYGLGFKIFTIRNMQIRAYYKAGIMRSIGLMGLDSVADPNMIVGFSMLYKISENN